jgi:hypothetical protein
MTDFTQDQLKEAAALYAAMQAYKEVNDGGGMHTKTAGVNNSAQLLFGNTGLFAVFGLDSNIITSYVRPAGIGDYLAQKGHVFPTIIEQPVLGLITGIQDDGAAAVANPCDDAPTGYIKACNLFFQTGRLQFDTATIEFDKIFTQLNAGVNTDLTLRGKLLGMNAIDTPRGLTDDGVVKLVTLSEMVKVGMLMERGTSNQMGLIKQMWQGTNAMASAGGGYKTMIGLDSQITTGIVDAQSNAACQAADSDVKNFNFAGLFSNNANNTPNIVWYLSMLEYYLRFNATRQGLDPVEWVVVMNPNLWAEFTSVWPIAYNTNRGAELLTVGNTRLNLDARAMTEERDAMRNQMTVAINGRIYPVVVDDGINELNNITSGSVPAGSYASSIYMVPLTINGGFPVTYLEYYDYRVGMAQIQALMGKQTWWTDGGLFSWAMDPIRKWCYKLSAKTERRIVLRTPSIAGRIDNILYSPLQHLIDNQAGSAYAVNGGVSTRAASTLHAVWNA